MSALKFATNDSSSKMNAWVLKKGGDIAEIEKTLVEIPTPGANEIRVKLHASSTNPVDWKRAGYGPVGAAFPAIHGSDGAGVVDVVGEGVTAFKAGDRVHFWGNPFGAFGTYAEYTVVAANAVAAMPEKMSFEVAAAIPCAGWTAYEALFERMHIQKGKWIYIASGAGGVGHLAVQMASKVGGCRVITTASGANAERLRKSGLCELVIDYKTSDVKAEIMKATNDEGCDYVFEMLGDEQSRVSLDCVKFAGQYCHIAQDAPRREPGHFFLALTTHHVFTPGHHMHPSSMKNFMQTAAAVDKLVASGEIEVNITNRANFDSVKDALLAQQAGRVSGKVVVNIA